MKLDWVFVLTVTIATVGTLQYVKALLKQLPPNPGTLEAPGWVWAILLPFVGIGLALLFASTPPWVAWGVLAVVAAPQLSYDVIVKIFQKKIDEMSTRIP